MATPRTFEAMKAYIQEQVALNRPYSTDWERTNLYQTSVTIYAMANYRAEALTQVRFRVCDAQTRKPVKPSAQSELLQSAFDTPYFKEIMRRSEITYCFWGANLLYKETDANSGAVYSFRWLNPTLWILETSFMTGLVGFRIMHSDSNTDLNYVHPPEAVYMHGIDFRDDFRGVGPAEVAFLGAATETEIGATQLAFFRNMAVPLLIIQPAEGEAFRPGKDEKDTLVEYLRRMFQGAVNAGRTLVTPSRWEMQRLTTEFDKVGMPALTQEARDSVSAAMSVPLELILPSRGSSRTAAMPRAYETRREWLLTWLVTQSQRYADIFTEQAIWPINPDWVLLPDFTEVRGMEEDIAARTATVKNQVADTLLSLDKAQEALGLKVDPRLKDLYMVGGVPVPADQLKDYWRFQPGIPAQVPGHELNSQHVTKPTATTNETTPTASTTQVSEAAGKSVIPFLGDSAFKELKDWQFIVSRKGPHYPFEAKSLRPCTVSYGRLLLGTGDAAQSWTRIREDAAKDYDNTEGAYRAALYDLMTSAFAEKADRREFGDLGRAEIGTAFYNAFMDGLKAGGVDADEPEEDEKAMLDLEIKAEKSYWTALSNELYREVMPKFYEARVSPALAGEFMKARDAMLGRIDLWSNKGLARIREIGVASAKANQNLVWQLGATEQHCETCKAAAGQIHRSRDWLRSGVMPKSSNLACEGFRCDCNLVPTTDKASGSLAGVPLGEDHVHVAA